MSVHVPPPAAAEISSWSLVHAALEAAPTGPDGWTGALARLAAVAGAAGARLDALQGGDVWTVAAAGAAEAGPERLGARVWSGEKLEFRLILLGGAAADAALDLALARLGRAFAQAIRTQLTIESEAVRMAVALLRRAGQQPIVCTPDGEVIHAPEAGSFARLPIARSGGRLAARSRDDDARLRRALREAVELRTEQVLVLGREGESPAVLHVLGPLTGAGPCFRRHAVVLVRGRAAAAPPRAPILQQLYGLTAAEAMVAVAVSEGAPVADIAARRGVAASTVRAQVKTVLAKVGVGRQVELVQKLAALGG
jgi:DNA-binding CsgD family transcriptional regulator